MKSNTSILTVIKLFIKVIFIAFVIYIPSLIASLLTRNLLSADSLFFKFDDDQSSIIAALIQGTVAAVAGGFIYYQIRHSDRIRERQNAIEKSEFIFQYNQAFMTNEKIFKVSRYLGEWLFGNRDVSFFNETNIDNHNLIVHYLEFFEGLEPLVYRGILDIEDIDNLLGYRFFAAVDNPFVQEHHLFIWSEYYLGCFRLYGIWKQYRLENSLDIPFQEDTLDQWAFYEMYSGTVKIRKIKFNKLKEKDLSVLAGLMYKASPAGFKSVKEIYKLLKREKNKERNKKSNLIILRLYQWIIDKLMFYNNSDESRFLEKILIARENNKIVGMIMYDSKGSNLTNMQNRRHSLLKLSFDITINRLFSMFEVPEENTLYATCQCLNNNDKQKIDAMLILKMVRLLGKNNNICIAVKYGTTYVDEVNKYCSSKFKDIGTVSNKTDYVAMYRSKDGIYNY